MGLSGSGKSILVRHIIRLIEPTGGEIPLNGTDVGKLGKEDLREMRANEIGMVVQNTALLPHRTLRDDIAVSLAHRNVDAFIRPRLANKVIDLVHLQSYADRSR